MGSRSRRGRGRQQPQKHGAHYNDQALRADRDRNSGGTSSSDGGRTNDTFPVDALSLQARTESDRALDREDLESRADQVERALRLVDQEIEELERATVSQSGSYDHSRALVPFDSNGGGNGLGNNKNNAFMPDSQRGSMMQMTVPATIGMNAPVAVPQQVTINNFNHPVNQMFNSSTTHSAGGRSKGRRRGKRGRGFRNRRSGRHSGDDYQLTQYGRGSFGSDGSRSVGNSSSSSFDSLRSSLSSSSSYESTSSRRRFRRNRNNRGGNGGTTSTRKSGQMSLQNGGVGEGKNVFRDISKLAKEKADDEDKDLLMAIKASIGFAAAMIGEALFLRLREWLDNTKPSVKQAPVKPAGGMMGMMGAIPTAAGVGDWPAENVSHPAVTRARNDTKLKDLVLNLKSEGKSREAEMLLKRSLEIRRELYGNEHPAVAHTLNQLATLMCEQGKLDEAEPMFKDSLDICKKVYDENHPKEAILLNNLAVLMLLRANEDEHAKEQAAEMGMRALAIAKQKYGMEHPMTQAYLNDWGDPEAEKEEARQRAAAALAAAEVRKSGRSSKSRKKKKKEEKRLSTAVPLEEDVEGGEKGQEGEVESNKSVSTGSLGKHVSSKGGHRNAQSIGAKGSKGKGQCVIQ